MTKEEIVRNGIALPQAALGAVEWARDAVRYGQVEQYAQQGKHPVVRRLGVTAVGQVAEFAPKSIVKSVLGRLVLPRHNVISIGAESVVIDEGEEVRKVLTGKTEDPKILADRAQERYDVFKRYLEEYAVPTDFKAEEFRVFRWLPDMDYASAMQPKLDIHKLDVLEDDEFLRRNLRVKIPLRDMLNRLQIHTKETDEAADLAKRSNVVLLRTEEKPKDADEYWCPEEVQVRVIDPMIVNMSDRDFAGLRLPIKGIWTPQAYRIATQAHVERLAA